MQNYIEFHPNTSTKTEHQIELFLKYEKYWKQGFPLFNLSLVESTLDLIHKDHYQELAALLPWIFQRHLFLPYARKLNSWYDNLDKQFGLKPILARPTKNFRFYERGPDNLRRKGTFQELWKRSNIDRLRIEFIARPHNLNRAGLTFLLDFINGPKIKEMFQNKFRFVESINTNNLPKAYETYNGKTFMRLYHDFRQKNKRARRFVQDFDAFDPLWQMIDEACEKFNVEWQKALTKVTTKVKNGPAA